MENTKRKGKSVGNSVYSEAEPGYNHDPTTGVLCVPPTTAAGADSTQKGAQVDFTTVEVAAGGTILEHTKQKMELSRDKNFNSKMTKVGEIVQETPLIMSDTEPTVGRISIPPQVAVGVPEGVVPDLPQPPHVQVNIENEHFAFGMMWHMCTITPTEGDGPGNTVALAYDLEYDPNFKVKLPTGVEFDLTITTDNGSITRCKDTYYAGQTFTNKGKVFYVLFAPEVYMDE